MNKDSALIFEAYAASRKSQQEKLVSENAPPTEMGANWDTEISHEDIPEDTTKYMKQVPQELRGKAAWIVIKKIKEFITKQKGKVFLADFKSFRNEIAKTIKENFKAIDTANAQYTARKIQELLIAKGIIKDERNGKLRVTGQANMVPAEDIEKQFEALSAPAETPEEPPAEAPAATPKPRTRPAPKNTGAAAGAPPPSA